MADNHDSETQTSTTKNKPLLIIHRLPSFKNSFQHRLTQSFSLLDPTGDPIAFHRLHSGSASVLLCVGPTPLKKEILDCLPSLKCVVTACVGVDHIDIPECRRRGISIANVGDAFSDDVADCAVGFLIDVLRKLSGKRVGIVGLGSIGSRVATRLISFGCAIAYNSRHKKPSVSFPYYTNIYDLRLAVTFSSFVAR
ncbi:Glyoxylate/hydroxypyruvate reductase HPR3 [Bienertia sinuspersici]